MSNAYAAQGGGSTSNAVANKGGEAQSSSVAMKGGDSRSASTANGGGNAKSNGLAEGGGHSQSIAQANGGGSAMSNSQVGRKVRFALLLGRIETFFFPSLGQGRRSVALDRGSNGRRRFPIQLCGQGRRPLQVRFDG